MARIVVVGAGHAGLEAAFAAARVAASAGPEGPSIAVVTGSVSTIGQTPCNPAIGGVAKGHLVHEIHALGGFMGRAADHNGIHGRMLNMSKGPAVRATRVQVDKRRYGEFARQQLMGHRGIVTVEGLVTSLIVEHDAVCGVRLRDGGELRADAVVLTTGTFLGGLLHTGSIRTPGGRVGEPPASGLSDGLRSLGFRLSRLKTGTPPRLDPRTIDVSRLEPQPSDDPFPRFCSPDEAGGDGPGRVDCHITHTNRTTHAIIRERLGESPMYSGQITGVGPRYCPSIEDKVVRFAERERHQIFLEPEGLGDEALIYPNGISTSLPPEVQESFVHSILGLERARVVRHGYAVEYDAVDARSLTHTLVSKDWPGLYFAGQINGTSGYEEAGIQGLIAGANAALESLGRAPMIIERDRGYAGVLVDDLVSQGCDEPYRMFTSRAEYRLLLREDNADERLAEFAFAHGLIDPATHERVRQRLDQVERCVVDLERGRLHGTPSWILHKARARITYAGYLDRQQREVARIRGAEGQLPLASDLDYFALGGLTHEAAERLSTVRPADTGQAARIAGITPAALACLWAHARASSRH